MLSELIKDFCRAYEFDVKRKMSKDLNSYPLIINEIPEKLINFLYERKIGASNGGPFVIKGSIGQGNTTYYPWIGVFDQKVSSGATNGFYVVMLFSDNFKEMYLTLNQGSTIQKPVEIEKNKNFVYRHFPKIDGFVRGELPPGSLVKRSSPSNSNKGKKYEKTNMFYKKYIVDEMTDDVFLKDLENLTRIYSQCAVLFEDEATDRPIEVFDINQFAEKMKRSNLIFQTNFLFRFVSSLCTKPFVILTGLSGSGKTKLAQSFSEWICETPEQTCLIPVGADWTSREPLLGFPNALEPGRYVKPDNRVLDLLLEAGKPENSSKPYFLILDEMNLSHVERYFADFLSAMESGMPIPLHPDTAGWKDGVPSEITLPPNLFIVGTVNIDETTYMFSPKVLDRANVIEFRVTEKEILSFLDNPVKVDLTGLRGAGSAMAADFVKIATEPVSAISNGTEMKAVLGVFFRELKKTGSEFGYRTAVEICRFGHILQQFTEEDESEWRTDDIIDAAVMQKLLPKLHGSRKKLTPVLDSLAELCLADVPGENGKAQLLKKFEIDSSKIENEDAVRFKLSLEKIIRMKRRVTDDGFTSFAEA